MKKILEKYKNNGKIFSSKHETNGLEIWNYSKTTQYDNLWDEVTLQCRSLVTDKFGKVVARGFPKFFNWEEPNFKEPSDKSDVEIFEKLDGSFIMLFNYDGEWVVCSKGSFHTDQVKWAKEILKNYDLRILDARVSYCFELIHPENRIVVDYGDSKKLILTGIFDKNGLEYQMDSLIHPFEIVKMFDMKLDFKIISEMNI